ncbi:MAG: RNA 2',3'-cyclic phosphodiesterase [Myxococcota bacterium]|jgi:2'-5' RNA ligase
MRLFIAFDLPDAQKARVEALVEALKARVDARWTRAEGRHVTLVFLGETPTDAVPALTRAIDAVAARHRPHTLHVAGAGTFGASSHPRVLWLGLGGDLDTARALQADLRATLAVKDEHDGWAPHLTLARSKHPKGDAALVEAARALERERFASFSVDEVVLFESRGGRYGVVHTAKLSG